MLLLVESSAMRQTLIKFTRMRRFLEKNRQYNRKAWQEPTAVATIKFCQTFQELTSQKFGLQLHAVEVVDSFVVVGLDLSLFSTDRVSVISITEPRQPRSRSTAKDAKDNSGASD